MTLIERLQELVLNGWRFWLDNGRLKFRAPKTAASPDLLQQLRDNKPDIIQLLQTTPEKLDIYHLSYGQRALWFLWKLSPQSSAYNQSLPIRIHHAAEDNWRRGCAQLLVRHPMLRTVFPEWRGEPLQQVNLPAALNWTAVDGSGWDEEQLLAEMTRVHRQPFDLENNPPIRFHWFTRAAEETVLLISMHHIICDGWSLEIMRRELAYLSRPKEQSIDLPLPNYTYHDYVRWHLRLLNGDEGEHLWNFWREQLNGRLPVLELPTDYPRPRLQTYQGAACDFQLPGALAQKVRRLAKEEGATLYETFLSAFFLLLYRLSGQKDILIGSPTAGRSRAEFAPIVGYFVNPVVIRMAIPESESFRSFLSDVQHTTRKAMDHGDFPFPLLVQKLLPDREPNRSPVFDVTFNYLNQRAAAGSNKDREIEIFDIPQADGKFDLTLTLLEDDSGIRGSFGYNVDLFEQETVAQYSATFITMLESIARHPDELLEVIRLQKGPGLWPALSGPQRDLTTENLFHRLFEEQAAINPQAAAVSDQEMTLSYAALNAQANHLAAHLQTLGIGPEDRVAICTERSVVFITAMLGVLKAGASYVPLETTQPNDLRDYMMSHAGAAALLTQRHLQQKVPVSTIPVIDLDQIVAHSKNNHQKNVKVPVGLNNLAYVMYTSGSTGQPKGVAIEHEALANYIVSILNDLSIAANSNFALVSSFAADLGNTVIFPALCSGGCLHIFSEEMRLDPKSFADAMHARAIDYLKIVPSHLAALMVGGDYLSLPKRALFLGGEGAGAAWVYQMQKSRPDCQFFNHYGPTEATIGVLTYEVDAEKSPTISATLPLNKAVANTDIFLLDQHLQSVPPGVIGELYIGGRCLAREYINDPQRTAESFTEVGDWDYNPAVQKSTQVLYKTGDLGRQRLSGEIEVLGRRDRQVKLRGYRIELAHIEAVLRSHQVVSQAVVLADKEGHQADRLIAYVAPHQDSQKGDLTVEQLRIRLQQYLEQKLPHYMVPGQIIFIENMPVTANGKLDTQSLRQLNCEPMIEQNDDMIFPRDLVELKLSQIWMDLLGLPHVGIHDDFFQLGGHSLLAVRLTGRIEEEFSQWVPLATLFTHPTIEKMANLLRSADKGSLGSVLVPVQEQGGKPPLFFLPGAGGSVMYIADLAYHLGRDQPVWGLQAFGLNGQDPIPQNIEEIAAHYIACIRNEVQPEGTLHLAGHSFGGFVAFEMAKQLREQGESISFLAVMDNAAPAASADDLYNDYGHTEWLLHIATRIGRLNGIDLQLKAEDLTANTYNQQIEILIDRLITRGLLPVDINKTHFTRFIEVYKANAFAANHYRPEKIPLALEMTLFKAQEIDLSVGAQYESDVRALGWLDYAASVEVVDVPGTHLSMFSEPHVRLLAKKIKAALSRSEFVEKER